MYDLDDDRYDNQVMANTFEDELFDLKLHSDLPFVPSIDIRSSVPNSTIFNEILKTPENEGQADWSAYHHIDLNKLS